MANWLKKIFKERVPEPIDWPEVDLEVQIKAIEKSETEHEQGLGVLIHAFEFHEYELRLDRDITGMYRVVAMEGRERRYSFSLRCAHRDYEGLYSILDEITVYLSGERRIAGLPNSELLKGHYYGHVEM